MPNPAARALALLFCCVLPAGCDLVDQRSFDRSAGRAPVPRAPPPVVSTVRPVPPLFVVRSGRPQQDWQPDLRRAVAQALSRKPNVLFTVESVAAAAASPAAQAASLRAAVAMLGHPVADAIVADGAGSAQVELTALSDPAARLPEARLPEARLPEVRVYVH